MKDKTKQKNAWYGLFAVAATFLYGLNVNFIKAKLDNYEPLEVASFALVLAAIPSVIILGFTDAPAKLIAADPVTLRSAGALLILGAIGTALVLTIFFGLVRTVSPLYAASVTYLMPIVALGWGIADGETLGIWHFVAIATILAGVLLVGKK